MKHETIENVAGWLAGVAAAAFFTVLFIAMSTPAAETVHKLLT